MLVLFAALLLSAGCGNVEGWFFPKIEVPKIELPKIEIKLPEIDISAAAEGVINAVGDIAGDVAAGVDAGIDGAVDIGARMSAGIDAGLDVGAGIDLKSGLDISAGIDGAVGGAIGAGLDLAGNLGAGISAGIDAGLDVGAGIDLKSGLDIGAGIDGAIGAGLDLAGNLGAGISAGIDAGLDVGAGIDLKSGLDIGAGIDGAIGAGLDLAGNLGAGISAGIDAGLDVGAGIDLGAEIDLGAGLNLGAGLDIGAGIGGAVGGAIGAGLDLAGNLAYSLSAKRLRWAQAVDYCKTQGGSLVNFNTEAGYNHVVDWLFGKSLHQRRFWTGMEVTPYGDNAITLSNGARGDFAKWTKKASLKLGNPRDWTKRPIVIKTETTKDASGMFNVYKSSRAYALCAGAAGGSSTATGVDVGFEVSRNLDASNVQTEMQRLLSSFKSVELAIKKPFFNAQVLLDAVSCLEDQISVLLDHSKGTFE